MKNGLPILIVIGVVVATRLVRRMRPGAVRPERALIYASVIAVASLLAVADSFSLLETGLGLALIPVALLAGVGLGVLLVRAMRFYVGPDGRLWAQGGILFVAVFLATIALRLGVEFGSAGTLASTGATSGHLAPTPLNIVSADLVFLSVGMWGSRALLIWRRHRTFVAQGS